MEEVEVGGQISVQRILTGQTESVEYGPFNINFSNVVEHLISLVVALN